jgi:Cu2+-exporting ATPase
LLGDPQVKDLERLAVPLRQPVIILTAIPLSVIGDFPALLLTGYTCSFTAFVGFTSLAGIVVNNATILADYANQLRERGHSVLAAAVPGRCRPRTSSSTAAAPGHAPQESRGAVADTAPEWCVYGPVLAPWSPPSRPMRTADDASPAPRPPAASADVSCSLCGLPTPDPPLTADDVEGAFCCPGCREVARTLDTLDPEQAAAVRDRVDGTGPDAAAVPEGADDAFLQVTGMHCTACESFLEAVAEQDDGVYRAEASYASEMVRLHYDPGRRDAGDLAALLTRGGYSASPDHTAADDEQNTVARLLIGGFFSIMVMMWYVVFFYPAYAGGSGVVALEGEFARYALGNTWVATTVVLGVTGWPLLRSAGVSLRVLNPNMDLLIVLAAGSAYLYSTGALLLGETELYFDVAVVIVFVVSLGRWWADRMKQRAVGELAALTREQVDTARRVGPDGEVAPVDVGALTAGETVRVRQGERVPVDGTVAEGTATVDESLVTGEARPVSKAPGDPVVGGSVVQTNAVDVRVGEGAQSTLDRLVRLMWEIQASTPGIQQVADRRASIFVPLVLALGVGAVGVQLALGAAWPYALLSGLTVLIVSCPCALGLATPLAVAAGTRAGLERSVVVKHAGVFEQADDLAVVVFDKTGTLTTGEMTVVDQTGAPDALQRARAVEQWSTHPVGAAVVGDGPAAPADVSDVATHPRGIAATVDGTRCYVGHPDEHRARGGTLPEGLAERAAAAVDDAQVPVVVGPDGGEARGLFVVGDTIRDEADAVLDRLRDRGLRIAVCTGDHEAAAAPLRDDPRIDEVFAGVRPEAKRALLQQWRAEHGPVAMVGDGSNDAPALADADLGVAFGPTALAADSADVVVLDDRLSHVPEMLALARTTRRRLRQNLGWAFGYNAVAIPTAIAGALNPLVAALAMAASSLLVVGNSARSMTS